MSGRTTTGREIPELLRPPRKRKPTWLRVIYVAIALVMFVLGIVGWLVPVVTGIPFYLIGIAFLAAASSRIRYWINRAEAKLRPSLRLKLRRGLHHIPFERFRRAFNFPEDSPEIDGERPDGPSDEDDEDERSGGVRHRAGTRAGD